MTAPLYDMMAAPVVADLLACLTVEMGKTPVPPAQVCVRIGNRTDLLVSETYDECCAGTAWVRLSRQYPSRNFPSPDDGVSPCDVSRWALVFELGAARCGPVADASSVPSCQDWTDVAVTHYADQAALRRAACCYAIATRPTRKVQISEVVAETTEGGCTSSTMLITVSASACDPVCKETT